MFLGLDVVEVEGVEGDEINESLVLVEEPPSSGSRKRNFKTDEAFPSHDISCSII
jgi:hypothetical protein